MEAVTRPVILLFWGLLFAHSVWGELDQKPSRQEELNVDDSMDYAQNKSGGQFPGDSWIPSDNLEAATARLVEELTKHGLRSSSPFALLLDPAADVWGVPGRRNSVVSFPLAQAETMARAAAAAAWQSPALQGLRDAFGPCAAPDADLPSCVREGVLGLLRGAARAKELRMLGGAITLTAGEGQAGGEGEAEAEGALPEDARARGDRLDDLILAQVGALASRTLTLRVPSAAIDSARRSMEEFRGKKGKGLLPLLLMMGLTMKGMMGALAMGTIAMIAGKALTVGLMALLISGVIGLKKLASQGGGGYEVVNVQAGHHHARNLVEPALHLDPYRAHAPVAAAAGASR